MIFFNNYAWLSRSLLITSMILPLISCIPLTGQGARRRNHPKIQTGIASYYGKKGELTASGERLNPSAFTAAHKTLPFGTVVQVVSLENPRRRVVVRINDRGPYVRGRILDLTPAAFKRLAPLKQGVVRVRMKVLRLGKGRRKHRRKRRGR